MDAFGTFMVWYLAVTMVAAIPFGVGVATFQLWDRDTLGHRLSVAVAGLGTAASAAYVVATFGPAFVAVVIRGA